MTLFKFIIDLVTGARRKQVPATISPHRWFMATESDRFARLASRQWSGD